MKNQSELHDSEKTNGKYERRKFLENLGLTGAGVLLVATVANAQKEPEIEKPDSGEHFDYHHNDPENLIYSVCLGCNTGCPTKVKVQNGAIVKIDGNPYTPWNRVPHLSYKTPIAEAAKVEGALCPKGQSGMMTNYDPHRIRKVLKRVGPRGAMQWKTMDFHEAIEEIVNGGKLFANVPGEESRNVEGLKDIIVLKDKKVMEEMGKAIEEIWSAHDDAERKEKVEAFKKQFADYMHLMIDPEHVDLGPKNNQFTWIHGRLKAGRQEFFKRFVQDGLGTANFHGHTTVCQGSLYFTGKAMSAQFEFDEKKKKAAWVGGDKFFWQADQSASEFIIFVGSSPFEANYPPLRVPNIMRGVTDGRLKYVVVDPRYSKTAAHAWKWLPVKPGMEGAFALGMIKWILDNKRYDERYLSCANKAAAAEAGEPTYCNASWLVKVKDGKPGALLRGSDLGMPVLKKSAKVKNKEGVEEDVPYEFDPFIVMSGGKPVAFDNNDETNVVIGDLLVDATVKDFQVKSALQLLTEEANSKSIEQWAEIAGIAADDIVLLAKEFTSHGKKAVFDMHRGVSQHTNGFYNCFAGNTLNLLIGNYDWRGGYVKASAYDVVGGKAKGPFNFDKGMTNGKYKPAGLNILKPIDYEKSTLFTGYPAKRPWFPHSTDVYQELLPSIGDAYPYPIKALLLYMGTPGYSLPAGQTQISVLSDINKLPLFIASDITIGESSMFADYIIPDLTFYERWEFHGSHPNNIWKVQPIRQPVIAPWTETVKVFGEEMPISLEAFMLGVAEKMGLKGFGKDGFGEGQDFLKPEDLYLRMVANIAFGEKEDGSDQMPDATAEDIAIFQQARKHLPKTVFDYDRWQKQVGPDLWKKAVYALNRGGKFQDYEKAFDGDMVKNKYGKLVCMYSEKVAKSKNPFTGKSYKGLAAYLPIADCMSNEIKNEEDTLLLITYREIFHTKSRTPGNKILMELYPENNMLINSIDAKKLGLKTDDLVRVTSDSNPEGVWELPNFGKKHMIGKIKVTEGIRPGVVAFALGFGHWAYGSTDVTIDGKVQKGDKSRGAGIHANAAMMIDPNLKNVCLQDLVGGSVSFYDSPVRLIKERARKDTLELV
ncbi:MAG: molybdopterin-dependent oxidoreductase [Bacteroidetes bacterium]|nr:molybdopterin-dependent oxidoreductase [Bacteroidota bacterium]